MSCAQDQDFASEMRWCGGGALPGGSPTYTTGNHEIFISFFTFLDLNIE
jgi:hypothetical protein